VFGLQIQGQPITDSECLLLRSPVAVEGAGGAVPVSIKEARGHFVMLRDQVLELASDQGLLVTRKSISLLPTPLVDDAKNTGHNKNRIATLASATYDLGNNPLFTTPIASEGLKASAAQSSEDRAKTGQVFLTNEAHDLALENGLPVPPRLLPTPSVGHIRNNDEPIEDYLGRRQDYLDGKTKGMPGASLGVAVRMNWGKYEPAIRRWESVLGRSAPAPTNPDGKEGAHRLAAEFVEWMMGLPEGWVTDPEIGLKRNDQLKALGNGVVPQQAELALQLLIDDEVLNKLGKK
jgi:DNA (cytosine-5)-methyltransferase 1